MPDSGPVYGGVNVPDLYYIMHKTTHACRLDSLHSFDFIIHIYVYPSHYYA